jgi:hypothetical protein
MAQLYPFKKKAMERDLGGTESRYFAVEMQDESKYGT